MGTCTVLTYFKLRPQSSVVPLFDWEKMKQLLEVNDCFMVKLSKSTSIYSLSFTSLRWLSL